MIDTGIEVFAVLLITGLVLVGAEIFVPGGVLGAIGGLSLLGACAAGFKAFPGYGGYVATAIVVLTGLAVALWIRLFPRTRIGRKMTLSGDLQSAKATEDGLNALAGKNGEALSDLRPAGFAMFDGQRVDVVTQGGMIRKGEPVRVVQVEGNRVVVSRSEPGPAGAGRAS